ncbi:transposable element tc3 transposase [Trichonephila clavipes]|nr:transposable element tc3 transposase [Trichonephila clavipes]
MIRKFEPTGSLGIQPGRGRKCVAAQVVDNVATQVEEDRSKTIGKTSVRRIAASVVQPRSTVHKILRKVLRYYPYKLSLMQPLLPDNLDSRQTFALRFLERVEI